MEDDLKPLLLQLLSKIDTVLEGHKKLEKGQTALEQGQKRIEGDVRELKGQMTILTLWMQSIDQRFMALMAPVSPPRKPAAE